MSGVGDVGRHGGNAQTRTLRVVAAERLSRDLDGYRQPVFPDRPADVPDDDAEAARALAVSRQRNAAGPVVARARALRAWIAAVDGCELRSFANLQLLYASWEDLRDIDECAEAADRLRACIEEHWPNLDIENVPPTKDVAARQRALRRAVRREDVMPSWLLYGQDPPDVPVGNEEEREERYWDK